MVKVSLWFPLLSSLLKIWAVFSNIILLFSSLPFSQRLIPKLLIYKADIFWQDLAVFTTVRGPLAQTRARQ